MPDRSLEVYEFGDFRLDVGERVLEHRTRGDRIAIPEKAFQTLVHLVREHGVLVRRDAILATIWPGVLVEEGNIGKVIHAIRRALGDRKGESTHIETVPKHGYRFVAAVTRVGGRSPRAMSIASIRSGGAPERSPAYDLYIRGKLKARGENLDDTSDAIALLEAAVELDPGYAPAYAQLARAYNARSFKFASLDEGKRFRENADVALAKALDVDPDLAEAHFARGLILWTKAKGFPHDQAARAFRRALELAPDDDETHHQLSMVYSHVGLLDEAEAHVARAVELNPNNTMARFRAGVYAAWQCRFPEALALLKTVPRDVSPLLVDRVKAEVYVQLGQPDKARSIVDAFLAAHPADEGGSMTSVRAVLLARAGQARAARRAIAQAIELGQGFGHFHHTAYNIAAAHVVLHEHDDAVNWLEAAADDGFPCYPCFARDPNLDGLRGFPRFVDLLSQLQQRSDRFKQAASAPITIRPGV